MDNYAIESMPKSPSPIEKHQDLFNAVQQIGSVTRKASKLLEKIQQGNVPQPVPENPATKDVLPPAPPLRDVLSMAPDDIRERCKELKEILDTIQSEIF